MKKHGLKKSSNHAISMSQIAFPIIALPASALFSRLLTMWKKTRSKMNATSATNPAKPLKQLVKQDAMGTRQKERAANARDMRLMPNATTCKTRAEVSHLMTFAGMLKFVVLLKRILGSERPD
jgi:hypothetical protein